MRLMDHYYTVKRRTETLLKVEGSKFIAEAFPAFTEQEADERLQAVRKMYFDATHHCFAYAIGERRAAFHYSDDGEPSGTAGVKIFSAIEAAEMSDVLVVVTRYFGGTKLGVGGLGRAYHEAASSVLKQAETVKRMPVVEMTARLTYTFVTPFMNLCSRSGAVIEHAEYGEDVAFTLLAPAGGEEELVRQLTEMTNGSAAVAVGARKIRSVA